MSHPNPCLSGNRAHPPGQGPPHRHSPALPSSPALTRLGPRSSPARGHSGEVPSLSATPALDPAFPALPQGSHGVGRSEPCAECDLFRKPVSRLRPPHTRWVASHQWEQSGPPPVCGSGPRPVLVPSRAALICAPNPDFPPSSRLNARTPWWGGRCCLVVWTSEPFSAQGLLALCPAQLSLHLVLSF